MKNRDHLMAKFGALGMLGASSDALKMGFSFSWRSCSNAGSCDCCKRHSIFRQVVILHFSSSWRSSLVTVLVISINLAISACSEGRQGKVFVVPDIQLVVIVCEAHNRCQSRFDSSGRTPIVFEED